MEIRASHQDSLKRQTADVPAVIDRRERPGARSHHESSHHRGRRVHRLHPCRAAGRRRLVGDRGRLVHPLLRRRRQGGEPRRASRRAPVRPGRRPTLATLPLDRLLADRPADRSTWPRSPACAAASATGFDQYLHDNLLATQRLFEAARRGRLPAGRVRLLVVGVRRRRGVPLPRGRDPDAPALPVRRDQAGLREPRRHLRRHGAADASACGTSPSTARGSGPTWPSAGCARRRSAGRRSRCDGDGAQIRDFTYVDDAVDATVRALTRRPAGPVLNIGGGERGQHDRGHPRARQAHRPARPGRPPGRRRAATCAAPPATPAGPGDSSAGGRGCRCATACAPSWTGSASAARPTRGRPPTSR